MTSDLKCRFNGAWIPGAVLGLAFSAGLVASAAHADTNVYRFIWENDTFQSFGRSDRAYTNGMRYSVMTYSTDRYDPHSVLEKMSNVVMGWVADGRRASGWAIGQNMYTPTNIAAGVPDPADRPYGGVLYFGSIAAIDGKTAGRKDYHRFEIDLGVIGPASLAEQSQKLAHETIGAQRPRGWDYQVPTRFAAGFLYDWFFEVIGRAPDENHRWSADLLLNAGTSLGNIISDVHGGAMARAGINAYAFWPERIRPTYMTSGVEGDSDGGSALGRLASGAWRFMKPHELYVWGSINGKVSLGNIFIDEGLPEIKRQYDLWDYSYGAALGLSGKLEFAYQRVTRSKEFRTQADTNSFGSISVAYIRGGPSAASSPVKP